jgi:Flp pilus assembly protein TadG
MFALSRRARRDDRGAAALEFALILPLLVVLIFGMIQFGFAFNAYITVTHAAREGVRLASVGTPAATVVTQTKAAAAPLLVTVTGPTLSADKQTFSITVSYPYDLDIPLWGTQSLNLSSTAQMRKE